MNLAVIVLAKKPRAARVKTRLCPPCTYEEAADIAAASLELTLEAAARSKAARKVLACDEQVVVAGFETILQRGATLADRLASAFVDVAGPAFLVAMDTPQVSPELIDEGLTSVGRGTAVIGPTEDGGYWGIGLPGHRPRTDPFAGVPMSRRDTFARQVDRLRLLGFEPTFLPALRDVDVFDDALAVSRLVPDTSFAELVGSVS